MPLKQVEEWGSCAQSVSEACEPRMVTWMAVVAGEVKVAAAAAESGWVVA